jgi:purine nucleosidase
VKKVLLDFDIGTEIDDAIALAYLLANPECELVGITTSCGESIKRAEMASVLCRAAGKKVPIHAGCERPLLIPQMETTAPQAAILPHYEHDTGFAPNTAIPFMQKVIRENPGEVTLLAVAPMTNLGLLFAMDPELPELLDGLYLLCGSPTHQRHDVVTESLSAMERDDFIRVLASQGILENNSIVDPHATSIVYRARCRNFVNIGNNVSSRVVMTPEEAERRFRHPIMQVVMSIAREWFKDEPRVSFHDPLAAVCIFNDDVCSYKRGYMDCVLDSRLLGGMTIFREDPAGPHQVAWDVDGDKFFEHLFEVFA